LSGLVSGFTAGVAPFRSFGAWSRCFFGADAAAAGAGAEAAWARTAETVDVNRVARRICLSILLPVRECER
jgi:hypothetical protein